MSKSVIIKMPKNKKVKIKLKPKVSKVIKTYVKKTLAKNTENKIWTQYGINNAISSAVTPNYPTGFNLVPILSAGGASNQRLGNNIRIKKAMVRGHVNLLPYDSVTNTKVAPAYIKMWICRSKVVNTNALTNTTINADFFQGNGAELGFQGTLLDTLLTPNNDTWTVFKTKTVHLGLVRETTTMGTNVVIYALDNERFSASFSFDYTKYLKKKLFYIDGGTICQNYNLFLVFQCVYQDGSTSAVTSGEYHQVTRVEFEDA